MSRRTATEIRSAARFWGRSGTRNPVLSILAKRTPAYIVTVGVAVVGFLRGTGKRGFPGFRQTTGPASIGDATEESMFKSTSISFSVLSTLAASQFLAGCGTAPGAADDVEIGRTSQALHAPELPSPTLAAPDGN